MSDQAVTYGSYLDLEQLLALQHPRSQPEHPDELLFIVVHQASELWFKVILHELESLVLAMQEHEDDRALFHQNRINQLTTIVSQQLTSLNTLPPQRFAQFRGYLGKSSGSQSLQFRAIEAACGLREPHFVQALQEHGPIPEAVQRWLDRPTLQSLFLDLLAHAKVSVEDLYSGPRPSTLFFLAEALLDYDQQFARWRFGHVQLVERIIGVGTGGTGGTLGANYLMRTTQQRFFPELWRVRSAFYGAAKS